MRIVTDRAFHSTFRPFLAHSKSPSDRRDHSLLPVTGVHMHLNHTDVTVGYISTIWTLIAEYTQSIMHDKIECM